MSNKDWNDYGAITGPLIVTLVLILLAFAPVLDSKMWQTLKDIASIVTPMAAALVGYFAYRISQQQAQTFERQLRIARFDRRYAVYQAVMNLIADCLRQTLEMKSIYEYRASTESAEFLFDKTIADYVVSLRLKAIQFSAVLEQSRAQNQRNLVQAMSERQIRVTQEIEEKRQALFNWFDEQYYEANRKFSQHLSIE